MPRNFFNSQSIAVIGASPNRKKLGYQLLKNLLDGGFKGRVFPVNLKEKEILGLPTFSSVLDIQAAVELAVIIVPREIVPEVLGQCVHKEIPYVIVISAGFAEKDAEGKKLQEELLKITNGTKTRIIGPNCLGIVDTSNNLNLTFAAAKILPGTIGLILQSGAIGAAIFDWAYSEEIGISKFVSLGNKIHTTEIEALEILVADEDTRAIALYLEEITNPQLFLAKCRQFSRQKPIIILKGGMTIKGSRAAASHTGALSSPEELNHALFNQANLIEAETFEELLDFLELFSAKVSLLEKNTLAIVTNAGGPGILAVDAASNFKINLPRLTRPELTNIQKILPNSATLDNPFDLGGDADALSYQRMIDYLEKNPAYSAILAIVTPQTTTDVPQIAQILAGFRREQKILLACFLGGLKIEDGLNILAKNHLPHYNDPTEAIKLLNRIYQYWQVRGQSQREFMVPKLHQVTKLTDHLLISHYNLPYVRSFAVKNDAEVMAHVEGLDYPLVYKAAKVKHRGKQGKVGLNINNHAALVHATKTIGYPGILQEMVESNVEIIVGAKRDRQFGIVVLFGQGGIFVEEQKDISFGIFPLTENDLDEMIEKTTVWQNIKKLSVKEEIKSLIRKICQIMLENEDIQAIELNPLKVLHQKIVAVDIEIIRE